MLNNNYLYNSSFATIDKSVEFIHKIERSSYDEILDYIIEHYGNFINNEKTIDFPAVAKTIKVELDKKSEKILFAIASKDQGTKLISLRKLV